MSGRRRTVWPLPAATIEAALAAKRGHAVHVHAEDREGLWQAKAVARGEMIAGAAGYATERAALEALAGVCEKTWGVKA